jgi:hypothetical protein
MVAPVGPLATIGRKPRQVRKEATVSTDSGAEARLAGAIAFCGPARSNGGMDATSLLLLAALAAADTIEDHAPPPGIVGLLTPPMVEDGPPGCVRPGTQHELAVHDSPRTDARVRGAIRFVPETGETSDCMQALPYYFAIGDSHGRRLPILESGYEEIALAVLEARPPWFRLAIFGNESAWVEALAEHRHDTVAALLADGLDYFTAAWPGEICEQPDSACTKFDDNGENTVRMLESRVMDGTQWWKVEVTTSACGDIAPPRLLRSGWIPARSRDGRPTVWFHSRGC